MPRIAIVSAMHEELAAVLALMPSEQLQRVGRRDFWLGTLYGHDVVLVLSGIGKVAAASTATALIERFHVDQIIFTGVAGGLGKDVQVGDVVIATEFLQHDMDASPLFPPYEIPLYGRSRFQSDGALTSQLVQAVQNALPKVNLHLGLIISGDRFVATTTESAWLQTALPEALAVEMEGAAIAQVCYDYGTAFAAVRTISDRADDAAHFDFTTFIKNVASHYSAATIIRLLQTI